MKEKHIINVNDIYEGLRACPSENFHILQTPRVYFLDIFTISLK